MQKARQQTALLAVVIIALVGLGFFIERLDLPVAESASSLREMIASFGLFAPLAYILIMTVSIIIVPIPDFIPGLAAGVLFPWHLATIYTLIADFLGSSIAFYLGRRFGRPLVERLVRDRELRLIDHYATNLGGKTIFLLRLIPGFNFDLVAYIAGFTPISYSIFITATLLGVLPRRLGTYFLIDKSVFFDPALLPIGVLLSTIFVPIGLYWWVKRKKLLTGEK